jgi:hypothetical protein
VACGHPRSSRGSLFCSSYAPQAARLEPPVLIRARHTRTAYADFLIGAPGFEPGTSASRTQRSTGLSHAPHLRCSRHPGRRCASSPRGFEPRDPTATFKTDGVGWTSLRSVISRNARPRCASRPPTSVARLKPTLGPASQSPWVRIDDLSAFKTDGVGWTSLPSVVSRNARPWCASRPPTSVARLKPTLGPASQSPWVRIDDLSAFKTDGVGFEPTRAFTHTISNRAP